MMIGSLGTARAIERKMCIREIQLHVENYDIIFYISFASIFHNFRIYKIAPQLILLQPLKH